MQLMQLSAPSSAWIAHKNFECVPTPLPSRRRSCVVIHVIGESSLQVRKVETERLSRWLQGLQYDDCNLCLEKWPRNSSAPGYGMVAGSGGVKKGDVIVRVPEKAFMTEQTAANCEHISKLAARTKLSSWQAMCLHLLCERARGPQSPWHPYISLLPGELEMAGAHPMLWPQRTRSEWLSGSPMIHTIERRLLRCREDHATLLAAGASELLPAGPGSGGFVTEVGVRWAAAILLSRAFSLDLHENQASWDDGDAGPQLALVPWADMLNHSSKAGQESCLIFDSETRFATLRSHKSYEQGEQVYDSYGPSLSCSQLLLDYGFVDEENHNHAVEFEASVLGPVRQKLNAELLEAVDLPLSGAVFVVTQEGADDSVKCWTRAATASVQELKEAGWTEAASQSAWREMAASSAMARLSRPLSRENEAEVIRRLLWACETLSQRYPTTLQEDVENLAASQGLGPTAVPLPWAKKQAMRAIISEKLALEGAQDSFAESLRRLQSGDALHSIYRRRR